MIDQKLCVACENMKRQMDPMPFEPHTCKNSKEDIIYEILRKFYRAEISVEEACRQILKEIN